MPSLGRIEYLDGQRGLAVLLVMLFHAYARWPDAVPYGSAYMEFPPFKFGWLGVELFFLISGFVILMTLERCVSRREFLYRRWLRLFPAMLICSLLLYSTAGFFHERPEPMPGSALSLVSGLTFIPPRWWGLLFSEPASVFTLEGAFWSIFVEFKFYAFAAAVYFWRGKRTLIASLVALFLLATVVHHVDRHLVNPYLHFVSRCMNQLSFKYFGWFAAGAVFHEFAKSGNRRLFWLGVVLALLCCLGIEGRTPGIVACAAMVAAIFALSLVSGGLQRILSSRVLVTVGFVSYPLYLLHQNLLISMVAKLHRAAGFIPDLLLPVLPMLVLTVLAFGIAKFLEPAFRDFIQTRLAPGVARFLATGRSGSGQ